MEGEVRDLTVTEGAIPPSLSGSLLRIGPNLRYAPLSGHYNGWMGDGMVHALQFGDGQAHYRNRWLRTPKWVAEDAAGRAVFDYVLPSKALLSTGLEVTRPTPESLGVAQGSCNTSLTAHGGIAVAWGEGQSISSLSRPPSGCVTAIAMRYPEISQPAVAWLSANSRRISGSATAIMVELRGASTAPSEDTARSSGSPERRAYRAFIVVAGRLRSSQRRNGTALQQVEHAGGDGALDVHGRTRTRFEFRRQLCDRHDLCVVQARSGL